MLLVGVVVVVITILVLLWLFGLLLMIDVTVPTKHLPRFDRVLVAFPHADDEVFHAGGLMTRLHKTGGEVTYVILTKGERGTPDAHLDLKLKPIRTTEARIAAEVLGVTKLIQADFGDLELANKQQDLQTYLRQVVSQVRPSLIITYDEAGLYGHPDHIACSEVLTKLVREDFPRTHLWYPCFPRRLFRFIKLPEHMANDPTFKARRAVPTLKIFVGQSITTKIRAASCYKSQNSSRIVPIPLLPLWFFYSMIMYEYFDGIN